MILERLFRQPETRAKLSNTEAMRELFASPTSMAGVVVNEQTALNVPAIYAAVNIISQTIAALPLHLFKDEGGKTVKAVGDPTYKVIHDRANDVMTSYQWRKWLATRLLLEGRATSLIVKDKAQRPAGFIPLEQCNLTITQSLKAGKLERTYTHKGTVYSHTDVIDLVLMPKSDGFSHYSPITLNKNSIGLMIAMEHYGAQLFANGGVPPMTLTSNAPMSPDAAKRADDQIKSLLGGASDRRRTILPVPAGFDLKEVAFDPAKQQLIEGRRFQISEASRIFNIAPAMLHDLQFGSFANTEQQSLNYAIHTITPLLEMIEAEMNLKLFGPAQKKWVKFNIDGLQRGDFQSRMDGIGKAITSGFLTPNEGRALENRGPLEGGDVLFMQGANLPIGQLGQAVGQPD